MSRVVVTTEDGRYAGRFDWAKAGRWSDRDVNNNGSGGAGRGEAVMLTAGGKWVLEHWTNRQGQRNAYEWITAEDAQAWLIRNGETEAVEEYFGDEPDEVDRRVGRPEIGGRVTLALGADLLPAVDKFAARSGTSRAAAARRLAALGLSIVNPPEGMKPIVVTCDVVSGSIEIDPVEWVGDDARWHFVESPDIFGASDLGTDVEPWGEDEFGMERATAAVRDLGYTIGEWSQDEMNDQFWRATVTGRA
jgi:hypothetical protein